MQGSFENLNQSPNAGLIKVTGRGENPQQFYLLLASVSNVQSQVLDNEGDNVIAETLRLCTNINSINLGGNNITDEQLLPIVDAIKGGCKTSLENLHLFRRIGNAGCHALVTLLEDTNCNLKLLSLFGNKINNEGATTVTVWLTIPN